MTHPTASGAPTDAELVAYLDGELSPADSVRIGQRIAADRAVATRLDGLMKGARPFKDAFAPLLDQVPAERLDAMLARVVGQRQEAPRTAWLRRPRLAAVAASLALLALGAGLDRAVFGPIGPSLVAGVAKDDDAADWRREVAQYLSLFTNETLASAPESADARRQELDRLGNRLGLDLNLARLEFPEITLKQAETLDYDGRALGFLAYLDPRSGPVALCILAGAGADAPPRVERREGMTAVYWSRAGHAFMLIGRGTVDELQARADLIASRFGGTAIRARDGRG